MTVPTGTEKNTSCHRLNRNLRLISVRKRLRNLSLTSEVSENVLFHRRSWLHGLIETIAGVAG